MLELPHAIIGATIASKIPNPLISLPLAFLSHFLVDLIPHWNPSLYTEMEKENKPSNASKKIIILDVILSLTAGFLIASFFLPDFKKAFFIILACFAAVFLDVIEGFYFFLGVKNKYLIKLIEFQHNHQGRAKKTPGLIIQTITILVCLGIIFLT